MYRVTRDMFLLKDHLLKGRIFPHVNQLAIIGAYNVHPLGMSFPKCKSLLFYDCDKNTHYYCIPSLVHSASLSHLYVSGHPCDSSLVGFVLDRIEQTGLLLTIGERYEDNWFRYRGRERFRQMVENRQVRIEKDCVFEKMAMIHQDDLV